MTYKINLRKTHRAWVKEEKKIFIENGTSKELNPSKLLHSPFPLERKKTLSSIHPYELMTQTSCIIGTSRETGAATGFGVSHVMCRVSSTHCWLPTIQ